MRHKAVGAVEYMLSISPELRSAVTALMHGYPNWTDTQSYQLNVFLRYHLNDALAQQSFGTYAPAVGRAESIEQHNSFLLTSLRDLVDTVVDEFRQAPLAVPSLTTALLERSHGDPRGVLQEAIKLRVKAKHLRSWLRQHVDHLREDTPEGRFEIREQIKTLGEQLRKDVKLEESPRLSDAIDVRFVVGIPAPSVSGKKLIEWLRYRMASRYTAVLTDIVKVTAFSDIVYDDFAKLIRNCSRERR